MHHIELYADEPLPITQTGYRSHFFAGNAEMTISDAAGLVATWLTDEAQTVAWRTYQESRRQGDLFDL